MEETVQLQHTPIMAGLEHPSWPGQTIPAVLTGHEPVRDLCWHCACLASQIRVTTAMGDAAGAQAYGLVAIRHVDAAHGSAR
jgi:hypothetical protein